MIIYKYITFEDFISTIEKEEMFLRNIKDWEDPFEGYIPLSTHGDEFYKIINTSMEEYNKKADEINSKTTRIENILISKLYEKYCYAQCWLKDEEESDALWRIYSQGKGVRIAIESNDIVQSMKNKIALNLWPNTEVFEMEVIYSAEEPPLLIDDTNYNDKKTLFRQIAGYKRKAFEHEKEYRIGFFYPIDNNDEIKKMKAYSEELRKEKKDFHFHSSILVYQNMLQKKIDIDRIFNFDINLNSIKEIILDPRAPEYHMDMFFKYCKNRKLKEKYNIEFKKSGLYNRKSKNF